MPEFVVLSGGAGAEDDHDPPPAGDAPAEWERDSELRREMVALAQRAGLLGHRGVDWAELGRRCGLGSAKGLDSLRRGTDITLRTLRGILTFARQVHYDRLRLLRAARLLQEADLGALATILEDEEREMLDAFRTQTPTMREWMRRVPRQGALELQSPPQGPASDGGNDAP